MPNINTYGVAWQTLQQNNLSLFDLNLKKAQQPEFNVNDKQEWNTNPSLHPQRGRI